MGNRGERKRNQEREGSERSGVRETARATEEETTVTEEVTE